MHFCRAANLGGRVGIAEDGADQATTLPGLPAFVRP